VALSFDVCGCAQDGFTPLHWPAQSGYLECVRLLMERGADKDAKSNVRPPTRERHCRSALRLSVSRSALRWSLPLFGVEPRHRGCLRRACRVAAARSSLLFEYAVRGARRGARGGACGPCFGRSV
jgi:hypothetical protein